jgi:hypothetical protein
MISRSWLEFPERKRIHCSRFCSCRNPASPTTRTLLLPFAHCHGRVHGGQVKARAAPAFGQPRRPLNVPRHVAETPLHRYIPTDRRRRWAQRNQGDQDVRVGEVFVECTEKTGAFGFGSSGQGDNPALRGRRWLPEEKTQLAGPRDGGSVYAEWDLEVQDGNSGSDHRIVRAAIVKER